MPEEEAKAHRSNTVEGRGRGVKTLMNGCVFLHSLLQCGDRAAIIGAAHNESLQERTQKHARARAPADTHTLQESCLRGWLGQRAAGPCGLPEEVTKSWTQPVGLDSVILSLSLEHCFLGANFTPCIYRLLVFVLDKNEQTIFFLLMPCRFNENQVYTCMYHTSTK